MSTFFDHHAAAVPTVGRGRVVVFAPSPSLTITIEERSNDGDIHLHAGGQGVWQARMVRALGADVTLCATFAGETGRVLRHLIEDEGFDLVSRDREGTGAAYIHDRRHGRRETIIETSGDPLTRHDLDELYGLTLREGMDSDIVLLSGPAGDEVLPADVYRRLAADLRTCRCRVMADLSGARLDAALAGRVDIVKVSHEELIADGRIDSDQPDAIIAEMRRIRDAGADIVIVTRAELPLLLLEDDQVHQVAAPIMEVVDKSGAGDSFTAAAAATLAGGGTVREAVTLGAAAGALNVTRHGLGTGDPAAIRRMSEFVRMAPIEAAMPTDIRMTPDQLTEFLTRE